MVDPATPLVLSQADLDLKSAVYVCLFLFTVLAALGVYYTKINIGGSLLPNPSALSNLSGSASSFKFSDLNPSVILSGTKGNAVEKNFKKIYLVVFLLAMLSDWLQGPYVYALYQSYGFSHADNGLLFIFGFGSSMLFGTFIGGYADKYGRKKFAILYCIIYALSCCTKHYNSFPILCFGRVLAGIATSLLYSVFESWLVCESSQRGFSDDLLGEVFSTAIFGNSCVAISAGFIAQAASDILDFKQITSTFWIGKYCSPFDLAIIVLWCCGYYINGNWSENYGTPEMSILEKMERGEVTEEDRKKASVNGESVVGNKSSDVVVGGGGKATVGSGDSDSGGNDGSSSNESNDFQKAFKLLKKEKKLQCVGFMSSFFESSMFLFVFLWTPAVTADKSITQAPFGLIFSIFMLGCMVGSCLFSLATTARTDEAGISTNKTIFGTPVLTVYQCAYIVFGLSCVCHFVVVCSNSPLTIILAFSVFECCVGCYFPCIGIIKSKVVPENCRSTMYNFFRIPLNFIVCMALLINLPVKVGFFITTALLGVSCYLLKELGSDWQEGTAGDGGNKTIGGETSSMMDSKLDEGTPMEAGI